METQTDTHFGQWLRRQIEQRTMSQTEFADHAKIKFWTLRNWLKSPAPVISGRHIVKLSRGLGKSREEVEMVLLAAMRSDPATQQRWREQAEAVRVGGRTIAGQIGAGAPIGEGDADDEEEDFDNNVEPYSEEKVFSDIPLFELSVAAGDWADVSDVAEVHQPGQIDHGLFRIHISGDSMTPDYPSGIIVEFHCLREGRDQLEVGRDYYVQREDGRATFKRLEKIDETRLVFRALNKKKYRLPMPIARKDIVRMARAVFKGQIV